MMASVLSTSQVVGNAGYRTPPHARYGRRNPIGRSAVWHMYSVASRSMTEVDRSQAMVPSEDQHGKISDPQAAAPRSYDSK